MEIKYEPVFGDQSLLAEAGTFTGLDVVVRNVDTDLYHYCRHEDLTYDYLRKNPVVAMRRIIAEPKRWTVADQNAGRLPEVGCRVNFCHKLNTNWRTGEIKYIDDQVAVIKADGVDRPFVYEVDRVEFNPIETPAEKAQREEDAFVVAMLDAASQEQLMSAGFKSGVIAAYRKLKGGE